jgi:hypothetical protein
MSIEARHWMMGVTPRSPAIVFLLNTHIFTTD